MIDDLKLPFGIVICLWTVAVCLLPVFPVDETRYLTVAWEMLTRHSLLIPLLNDLPYAHKPPLFFWMIIGLWRIFTVNAFLPRLIPLFFSLANLVLLYRISLSLWPGNRKIGKISTLMLCSCPVWIYFSSAIMFDMVLTFWVLLALLGLLARGKNRGWLVGGIALGGGLLTKGPVIFVHVLPCILLQRFWGPRDALSKSEAVKGVFLFLSIGVFLGLSWAIPAAREGGQAFSQAIFWHQTAGRMVRAFAHGRPVWWYLPLLPLLLFPWGIWHRTWHALFLIRKDKGSIFCLIWMLIPLCLFSLISGKQIHYLIPEMPAFTLLAAKGMTAMGKFPKKDVELSLIVVYLLVGIGLFFLPWFKTVGNFGHMQRQALLTMGAGVFCLGMILFLFFTAAVKDKLMTVAISAALFTLIVYGGGYGIWKRYDLMPISEMIGAFQRRGCAVAIKGKNRGEFAFLGRLTRPLVRVDSFEAINAFLKRHRDCLLVTCVDEKDILPDFQIFFRQKYKRNKILLLLRPRVQKHSVDERWTVQIRYKINLWITSLGLLVNLVLVAIILFEAIELAYETLDEELEIAIREDFKPLAGMTGTVFDYQLFDRLLDFDEQYWIKVFDENKKTVFASPLAEQITIPFKETGEEYNYDIRLPEESPFFNGARYEKTVMPDREMAHGGESAYVPVTFRVHLYRFDMGGSFFHVQIARSVEALKHEIHELIYIVITGFFVATVLLLVLSFFLTKKILQPIVEINALAQDISASNMDRRIPLGKSQDELYMLSESLNRMFDRLQQSFASQKQLVADAAHELKSPITMLLLFMERSMERRDLPAEYADQLMTQVGILRRMGRLIKNLLDISLLELQDALHLERVDLEEMVDKLLDDFEVVFASAGIQVEKQVPSGCWIRGDREKLQRLLINLVDNAIKYNVERGRIKIGVTEKNDGIQLSVWNTGVGIPVEELHHVLKKFYRVEKSRSQKYGGSGLGLTIVHRIAELHGGDVLMESEPTKWCRATVFLPCREKC